MLKFICGKYYEDKDDLILTPTLVFANASYNDLEAKAICIAWFRFAIGIAWLNREAREALKRSKAI